MNNPSPTLPSPARKPPRGRLFQPGNQAAKGRRKSQTEQFRDTLRKASTPAQVKAVWVATKEKALAGDLGAIRLFLSYAVGQPSQMIDVTHHDVGLNIPAQIKAMLAAESAGVAPPPCTSQTAQPPKTLV